MHSVGAAIVKERFGHSSLHRSLFQDFRPSYSKCQAIDRNECGAICQKAKSSKTARGLRRPRESLERVRYL